MATRDRHHLPAATAAIAGFAVAFMLLPGAALLLEYDRVRVVSDGQWWRLLSGQLVHWNTRMAVLDLGVVVLLGLWAESLFPRLTRAVLLAGLVAIGAGIHFGAPALVTYRGASGLASALFVLVALLVASKPGPRTIRVVAIVALVLLASKFSVEAWTGTALFAGPLPDGVRVTPWVHLLGAGTALALFLVARSWKA